MLQGYRFVAVGSKSDFEGRLADHLEDIAAIAGPSGPAGPRDGGCEVSPAGVLATGAAKEAAATEVGAVSAPLPRLAFIMPCSRRKGFCDELLSVAKGRMEIPLRGFAQSLSLNICCCMVLASLRARGLLGIGSLRDELRGPVWRSWLVGLFGESRSKKVLRAAGLTRPPPPEPTSAEEALAAAAAIATATRAS